MPDALEPVLLDTPAGSVAVHVLGAGRPTVLWHGLYVDGSSWGYLLPALLTGRRLLVVDGPGWGRSGRPRAGAGPDAVLEAARTVVGALSPDAPVDWLGTGWGGRVGLEVAARSPDLVRSVVAAMADPAPMPAAERRVVRRTLRRLAVVGPVGRAIVADQLSPASRTEPQTVGAVLDALLLAGRIRAARSVGRFDVGRQDLTDLLPMVTAPVLLLAGDDDGPWPEARAAHAAALMPFARVERIPGTRALVALDDPAALAAAVRGFWEGLASPG